MRVYLSKSNLACPYLVDMVRQIIQKEGHVVLEHHGGDYNPDLLLSAHCLVLVPNSNVLAKTIVGNRDIANIITAGITWGHQIGKGQYEQIKSFWANTSASDKRDTFMFLDASIICLEEVGDSEIYTGRCDSVIPNAGGDWKVSYANLEISSSLLNLKAALDQAELQNKAAGINTKAENIIDVSAGMGKTFVPKSYGNGGITVPGYHGYDPQRGVYPLPGYEKEIANMAKDLSIPSNRTEEAFMKNADGTITLPKQKRDGETYKKDCFDGVPHLACRMLYNL